MRGIANRRGNQPMPVEGLVDVDQPADAARGQLIFPLPHLCFKLILLLGQHARFVENLHRVNLPSALLFRHHNLWDSRRPRVSWSEPVHLAAIRHFCRQSHSNKMKKLCLGTGDAFTQHTTHNTQHTTHNTQHKTHNTQHTTHNTQHTTHNTQRTTHNALQHYTYALTSLSSAW